MKARPADDARQHRAQPCPSRLRLFFAVHRIKKPKFSGRDRRTLLELILVLSRKYWQELL